MPKPSKMSGTMKTLMGSLGDAYELEKMIEAANTRLVSARVAAVLAGKREGESFKTLLREVMCDVGEPTLAASQAAMQKNALDNDDPSTILLPAEMFSALQRGGRGTVAIPRQVYKDAVAKSGQTVGGKAGDTMFAFFVPERSFVDDSVADALVAEGALDADTLTDLEMTDFTNPVFSTQAFVNAFPAIDESPALIPKDKLGVAAGSLHMHEDCTAQPSESVIE